MAAWSPVSIGASGAPFAELGLYLDKDGRERATCDLLCVKPRQEEAVAETCRTDMIANLIGM